MKPLTVWYDGACPICSREIALLKRLDWRRDIDFVDLTGPGGSCPLDRGEMLARLHVLDDGRMISGAEAFAALWRRIPLLSPLGRAARNPTVLRWLEKLYLVFLRRRSARRPADPLPPSHQAQA
jgi:predicted DCC family thiol-disulfide oxidoreductase YuxK